MPPPPLNSRSYWDRDVVESFMLYYRSTTSFEISWVEHLVESNDEEGARKAACHSLKVRTEALHEARVVFQKMRVKSKIEEDKFHLNQSDDGWDDYLKWRLESCYHRRSADRALLADLMTCQLQGLVELLSNLCLECRTETEQMISEFNSVHIRRKKLENMRYGLHV